MQRKLYTEFDLLYDFISATVFDGTYFSIFFWVGYEFTSGAFRILFHIHLAVMLSMLLSIYKLGWPNVPLHKNLRVYIV